jgi:retron-type reverse transcriptase
LVQRVVAEVLGRWRQVSWVLDADLRGFFEAIDHQWLVAPSVASLARPPPSHKGP